MPRHAPAPRPAPDRIAGRYAVIETLGRGGMGAVYRVRDDASGRELALKQMTTVGRDERVPARLRFRREFHTMASLRHPRIVEVYDYGIAGEAPYYTLELLDGEDLHDLDRVPARRACELLRDVASALAFLHARRLLHRDLATRNVRCTADGRAKLIDFGVLATAGIAGDVAGTPPYISPETVRGRPLDHRTDLFGLGALAYRILAGRHAYPARRVDQLEEVWAQEPPPPSAFAPDIPAALDELVGALLALDPLARPAGAAEVIDRLTVIGGLARIPEVETTHGWIASAALIGRKREMGEIRRAVGRAAAGAGRSVLIEAPSGTGKSRMLRELALEAQLAGACVVRSDGGAADRGPYGVLHELARALIAAAPEDADAAARPRAATLARVVTSLRARLEVRPAPPAGDPAEDRMQLQTELAAWFVDVAQRRPLALLVDDVQRCDEASAAVLAGLAHHAAGQPLLLACALRSDEAIRAPSAIASLCDAGQRIRLRGLDEAQLGELCRSLFGAVPHIPRLARWMHRLAGGSPLHSIELARHLVDANVIRYADGIWVVPEDPGREDLPSGLAEAMDARIRALPAAARALGEVLSVHGGELPLPLIVQLADTADHDQVFAALDRLAFDEILFQAGEHWRFRHDGLREALLRGLPDERRRALHRRVGDALAAVGAGGVERDVEIGWHLLRGGDIARGAELLERAGRALFDAQSFSDCIAPLEAALAAIPVRRRPARARLELQHMLLMAGCMADRKAALRHATGCVDGYRWWAGADVATRAGRAVGRHAGVALGLIWALIRWLVSGGRGPNPYEAFRTFFVVAGYATTIHSLSMDLPGVRRMIELIEPVAILRDRIPYAVYLLIRNLYHFPNGDFAITRADAARLLDILERDRITPIREIDRRTGGGGARYILALISVINLAPDLQAQLDALTRLDLRFFEVGADQARIILHRMRGEEDAASELEARVELRFVQLGSIWQIEAFMPWMSCLAYGLTRDMLGLRRTIEQLAAMCADGFHFEGFLAAARGEYLRERGDATAALVELEPLAARDDSPMLQLHALPAFAEALLVLGDHERARAVAAHGVERASDPAVFNLHARLRSVRALALAEAALGDAAAAAARLDAALAETAGHDSAMVAGPLHEARARVALVAGDTLAFHRHLAETEQRFRATRNPVLIARAQRLAAAAPTRARSERPVDLSATDQATEIEPATHASSPAAARRRGRTGSIVAIDAVTTPPPADPRVHVSSVLSGCRGEAERATRALELVIGEAHGASGYLFLRRDGALELVAPSFGDEPPASLRDELSRAFIADADPGADLPTLVEGARATRPPPSRWLAIPLRLRLGDASFPVGVAAVFPGPIALVQPDPRVLGEIARELFEAGDVTHARVE